MAWTRANMFASELMRSDRSKRSAAARTYPKRARRGALSRIEPTLDVPITCYQCRWPDCQWGGDRDELQAARRAMQDPR